MFNYRLLGMLWLGRAEVYWVLLQLLAAVR